MFKNFLDLRVPWSFLQSDSCTDFLWICKNIQTLINLSNMNKFPLHHRIISNVQRCIFDLVLVVCWQMRSINRNMKDFQAREFLLLLFLRYISSKAKHPQNCPIQRDKKIGQGQDDYKHACFSGQHIWGRSRCDVWSSWHAFSLLSLSNLINPVLIQ